MLRKDKLTGLKPFNINEKTRYLILGSFPSVKSLDEGFYYMHKQNKFYKILAQLFGVEYPYILLQKMILLVKHNIGLWDIVKSCTRTGSLDSDIKDIELNDLMKIKGITSLKIGCTGKKAYELTKKAFPELEIHYLSSPSPANAGNFDIVTWEEFFRD